MHYIGHRASETNPLRSQPLFTPAARVLQNDPLYIARFNLDQAEQGIIARRGWLQSAYAKLGQANRCAYAGMRRMRQADAFRNINMERRAMRDAHRKLDAARAEMDRLVEQPELPFPVLRPDVNLDLLPTVPRILREDIGTFPRGTTVTINRSKGQGWLATITRPGQGGGIATHHDTREQAQAWISAVLAAPTLH